MIKTIKNRVLFAVLCLTVCGSWSSASAQRDAQKGGRSDIKISNPERKILSGATAALLVKNYADALENRLKGKSVGYAFVVSHENGRFTDSRAGGDARRAPDANPRKMTVDDKLNIASVSKTITAGALLKLLNLKNIGVDTKMSVYLPAFWAKGANVDTITFRELLTHRSGLRCSKEVTFENLQECVAGGINLENKQKNCQNDAAGSCYNNSNYALFRMIIPALNGFVPKALDKKPLDEAYTEQYIDFVRKNVFAPIGLNGINNYPIAKDPALAYQFPSPAGRGDDFGDMTKTNASRGWNMSAKELSIFVRNLLFTEKILPAKVREQMKTEGLGLFGGNLIADVAEYGHGGYYPGKNSKGELWNNGELNSLILGFSNGVSVAVLVNSQLGPGLSLSGEAKNAMKDILK